MRLTELLWEMPEDQMVEFMRQHSLPDLIELLTAEAAAITTPTKES